MAFAEQKFGEEMIFGFTGRYSDRAEFERLARHVPQVASAGSQPQNAPITDAAQACCAPWTASSNGITVALKGELISAGPVFSTDGANPAEAVLQHYLDRGERCLAALGGRFAVAILDSTSRKSLLAIDPMGIERLAYAVRNGGIVFSSSAEWVARFPSVAASLSNQALFSYLITHVVPAPQTVFDGVSKLQAGCCVIFEKDRLRLERYWKPRFTPRLAGSASFDDLNTRLHESLRTAVRACRPDESTGAFLSGGLDSSTVAGVLSEVSAQPARTFSIGFGYSDYDELPFARIANERFGCQAHEYVVRGADIASMLPKIARAYDEPFGNSSALPVLYCARLAREHGVTHLLAGDGGDELFAGNSRYAQQRIFELYRLAPRILSQRLEQLLGMWPDPLAFWPVRKARSYIAKARVPLPERLEAWNVIYQAGPAKFLEPDFLAGIDPQRPIAEMRELWNSAPADETLHRMLFYDWQYTLADNDLRKVETMCGLAGVRVSYPMLHPQVIDASLAVPPEMMMPGTKLRHFYKRAMSGFLPNEIIHKRKHGFGLPFGLLLRDSPDLHEVIGDNLSSLRSRRMIRSEFIDELLDSHKREDANHYGVFVWVLAMLEQWFREHSATPGR
jgi:asparagine synthase (glutamine-hydrolysing)